MGPSSGISTAFDDCRAEEARVVLDLRVVEVVEVRVERVVVRPGMMAVLSVSVCCRLVYMLTVDVLHLPPLSVYIHIFPHPD